MLADDRNDQRRAVPGWMEALSLERTPLPSSVWEAEWFGFDGEVYRRDRLALASQKLIRAKDTSDAGQAGVLSAGEVRGLTSRLAKDCGIPGVLAGNDDYPARSAVPSAPVYRAHCGELWFDIDGADGNVLQRLDASRRAYRWFYAALHTLDFPILMAHPLLRDILIVGLCALGFVFSMTGVVIGWRRLRLSLTV